MGFKVIKTTGLFFLVIGAIFWLEQPNLNTIGKNHKNYSSLIAFADENAEVNIVEMTLGSEEAEVDIVEYASYTCPHCATFHTEIYPRLKKDYIETGKVRFIYREVYFDKYGLWASMIARCAGPEKFFGLTDLIYKSQEKWTRAGDDAAIDAKTVQDSEGCVLPDRCRPGQQSPKLRRPQAQLQEDPAGIIARLRHLRAPEQLHAAFVLRPKGSATHLQP